MRAKSFLPICFLSFLPLASDASIYTWTGGTDLNWSTPGNWTPLGSPTLGDTVNINNTATNRTIYYDAAASGTLAALNITQTTVGGTNTLQLVRGSSGTSSPSLYLASDLSLGGGVSGAASLLWLDPSLGQTATTGSTINLMVGFGGTGTVTLNAGGLLTLGSYDKSGTVSTSNVYGNIAISGGVLSLPLMINPGSLSPGAITFNISGGITMSSGTLAMAGSSGASPRLWIGGNFAATGGVINLPSYTTLILKGTTNSISGSASLSGNPAIWLYNQSSGVSQSFSSSVAVTNLTLRGDGSLNNIRTISSSYAGTDQYHTISFGASAANGTTTMTLGSDLSSQGGASAGIGAGSSNTVNFAIDLNGHALAFSGVNWAPTNVSGNSSVRWYISNLSTSSTSIFTASSFDFSSASQVNVGVNSTGGVILSATGNATNNLGLSTSGTIAPNSIFRYVGTSGSLTSGRTIGCLEIGNGTSTSTLSLVSAALSVGGNVNVKTNSNLDLAGQNLTQTAVSGGTSGGLTGGGQIYNNTSGIATLTLNTANGGGVFSGVISDHTTGSGVVALTLAGASGTQTLTGINTYSGATTIGAGNTLQLGNGTSDGVISDSSAISNSGALVYNEAGTHTYGGIISGTGTVTKLGAGTQILSGNNTYTGATSVNAGELSINGSLASSSVTVASGARLSGSGSVSGGVIGTSATINGSGLNVGATNLYGLSTLSGHNIASSVTVAGGTTTLTGTTKSTSTLSVSAGATLNANGTIQGNASILGLMKGNSTVTGNLTLTSGTLAPGNSAGITTVGGIFTIDAASTLVAEVAGTVAGTSYDQVKVSGNVSLAGTLDLSALSGLVLGNTVVLIDNTGTSTTTTGYFTTIITSGSTYVVSASSSTYTFTVGSTEYELNYAANADNDGKYNDVTLTVVPEPSTWAILLGGFGSLVAFQRLRRNAPR